jgi:hypothetical protein
MCINDHEPTDRASSALGETERAWLEIFRHLCMSCERNDAEGWNSALSHAERTYGADDGPLMAARIAALLRAMQTERRGGFGYLSPLCPNCRARISEDEWQLLLLMKAGTVGEPGDIETAASHFARRSSAPLLSAAARRFGAQLAAREAFRAALPEHATLH